MVKSYKNIETLIRVFFGQDYDLFGETVEEIADSYLEVESSGTVMKVYQEADKLLSLNDRVLTELFETLCQGEFCPELWGETVRSFLEKIKGHFENKLLTS